MTDSNKHRFEMVKALADFMREHDLTSAGICPGAADSTILEYGDCECSDGVERTGWRLEIHIGDRRRVFFATWQAGLFSSLGAALEEAP